MPQQHSFTTPTDTAEEPLSVAALTDRIKGLLEDGLPDLWVAGEVSNLARPSSGHCYFTLKDDRAQIRAVLWRSAAGRLKFELADGMQLVCRGRIDVYGPRGTYQLVVDRAQPQGVGALELALRRLRDKLSAEGLFDPDKKRPLPAFPRRVAFVTSPTGAAVRDFLEVLARRWRGVDVLVVPTRVQGDGAAEEIAAAVRLANQIEPRVDALVVGRGGGSLEDLWSFNEEPVVRALAASSVPTISAVGHEIDVTLADLVADVRALTPSEAAERVAPSSDDLRRRVAVLGDRLHTTTRSRVARLADRLAAARTRRPFARPHAARLDLERRLDELESAARRAASRTVAEARGRVAAEAGKLESLSPVAVLGRGYSLTTDAETGALLRSADTVRSGQVLRTRLSSGEVTSVVD